MQKSLFILAHNLQYPKFLHIHKKIVNTDISYENQKLQQEKKLRNMVNFAYKNVPYYHKLFKTLNLSPGDIKKVEDLEKLPVLNKNIINENWEEFKPFNLQNMKYHINATGGTSGTPLKYRVLHSDRFLSAALLYRGWGYGGYELGDKMVFLAGSSLDIGTKSILNKKIHEFTRNIQKLSSFDMSEKDMINYTNIINSFKPKFIRGYPSSLYFYAKWLNENNIVLHKPISIFTTSEKLYPHMREMITKTFECEVFDNYGLNDGGLSAYECSDHNGLHIDTERSIMEIVDDNGNQINNGKGDILATSLNNFAMPFIRYHTGDGGHIIEDKCECGRESKLLKEVLGRSVDFLITPEGKHVHGWFFLYIMWEYCEGITEYQVIQEKLDKIVIKLVVNDNFNETQLDKIKKIVQEKSDSWNLEFNFVEKIERTKAGKYKFIINDLNK